MQGSGWFGIVVRLALVSTIATGFAQAAATQVDYERAAGLAAKYRELLVDVPENPVWVAGEDTLVYSKNSNGGHEFVQVNAASGQKSAAFDHARLADALSKAAGREFKPTDLPLTRFQFAEKKTAIEFLLEQVRWRCDLTTYHCAMATGGPGGRGTRGGWRCG